MSIFSLLFLAWIQPNNIWLVDWTHRLVEHQRFQIFLSRPPFTISLVTPSDPTPLAPPPPPSSSKPSDWGGNIWSSGLKRRTTISRWNYTTSDFLCNAPSWQTPWPIFPFYLSGHAHSKSCTFIASVSSAASDFRLRSHRKLTILFSRSCI